MTLHAGKIGQRVGTATVTGRAKQGTCERQETLLATGPGRITLHTKPADNGSSPGKECAHLSRYATLERTPNNTLTFHIPAGMTGILHRG